MVEMNFIKYKNKNIPVTFNYGTIKRIKAKYNIDLTNQDELQSWVSTLENQEQLFYEMIISGFKSDGKECTIQESEMEDILSEPNNFADFILCFQNDALAFITPSTNKTVSKSEEIKKKLKR